MGDFFIPLDQNSTIEPGQLNGYVLILPCISVGNVPQLATELLIYKFLKHPLLVKRSGEAKLKNRDLELIGYIRSKNVQPYAAPDSFLINGQMFSTSIQVFVSHNQKLIIIQHRSPIYKESREKFYEELFEWLSVHTFKLVLILSSSFNHFIAPEYVPDISNNPIMYLSSNLDSSIQNFIEQKLDFRPVIKVDPITKKPSENGKICLSNSGSARSYFENFVKMNNTKQSEDKTNILCLVMFCSEGENRYHSFRMADNIADILLDCHDSETLKFDRNKEDAPGFFKTSIYEQFFFDRYEWEVPSTWACIFGDSIPNELNIYG